MDEPSTERKDELDHNDLAVLESYLKDFDSRHQQKLAVLTENQNASKNRPDSSALSKLDSNLKKNSAFVKRLRNFTASQLEAFLKDLTVLNLSKYLSEVASALVEVKLKITDVPAAVQFCCNVHCMYADFSTIFQELWIKTLHIKKNEPVENVSKLRVDLRFYADLIAAGVLGQKEALPLLGTVLTLLTTRDKENHHNVNIIISFCKHCGEDFAGLVPKRIRMLCEKYNRSIPRSTILSPEKQNNVRTLFIDYFNSLSQHLVDNHAKLSAFQRQNEQLLRLKGELRAERLSQLDSMRSEYQALSTCTETLAELLDQNLPELPTQGTPQGESTTPECEERASDEGFWEDEETRCFYQVFPDLQEYLPNKVGPEQVPTASAITEEKLDEEIKEEDLDVEEPQKEEESSAIEEPEEAGPSIKVALEMFLNNLPTCVNREMIDNAAVEFLVFLNTKTGRRKLVKALFGVPRTRLDLLPFYGRLVAILNPVIPEIAVNLTNNLKQDFKYHIKKKDQINVESKIKVSRFIGELVKFGLFPVIEALYCLKLLLHDFTHHHIEMACNILEVCGRYLYRNSESHHRTKIYMDDMMRLKSVTALDIRYTNMIENAYYFVNPPEAGTTVRKKRPPLFEYIRKLLFQDLMQVENERKVLKGMRTLDWEDEVVSAYAIKCLSSAWKIKFHRVPALANLVAGLVEYQEAVGTKVVDSVLEDIRLGMEVNLPKMNQRRVAVIKYMGELYNYRLIESSDVFKVLYSLITFGVSLNHGFPSPLDPPDNLIRIRLVCTLLDTCSKFFSHSDIKSKLPFFMTYFQCYFWSKKTHPMWSEERRFPVYCQYQLQDSVEKNAPSTQLYDSFQDAVSALIKLQDKLLPEINMKTVVPTVQAFYMASLVPVDSQTIIEEDEMEEEELDGDISERSPDNNLDDEDSAQDDNSDDAEFLHALERMVTDNVQDRLKEAVRPTQEIAVPILGKANKMSQKTESEPSFVLLVRKGNKTQCKSLSVPADSDLVRNFKQREEVERKEMEKVKKLTLDIQRMQLEEPQDPSQENTPPTSNVNHTRRVRHSSTQKVDRFLDLYCSNK